jgi:type I restriction enzyme S subunit
MKAGWKLKSLKELGIAQTGSTPKTSDAGNFGDYIPFIKPSDFYADGSLNYAGEGLSQMGLHQVRRIRGNSVLMVCIGATIGKVGFSERDLTTNQQINALTPHAGVSHKFLYYQMLTDGFQSIVKSGAAQATLPILNKSKWVSLTVVLPPSLSDQLRIVGILDEAFDDIAAAKANAKKNLQNASALFESHLQAIFDQHGADWGEKRLEALVDAKCSLSYGIVQPGEEYPDGLPVIRPTDLTTKLIQINGLKRIDPILARSYGRTALNGGELLICVRGTTGVVSIAPEELAGANVTRGIVPIRFDESHLIQEFGYYALISGPVQKQVREKTYGAALMQINIRDLRNIMLPYPSLQEQERIVARLDTLRAQTQRLESLYRQKLAALDALKKSLLDQAFTGKL